MAANGSFMIVEVGYIQCLTLILMGIKKQLIVTVHTNGEKKESKNTG